MFSVRTAEAVGLEDVNVRPDIDVIQSISTTLICNPVEVLALDGGGRMRPAFQS
jgi:hypothetical protein